MDAELKILLSAYACEPGKGSEPGVGWNWAAALARAGHSVWVITRANNRGAIERALAGAPHERLRFVYYDLPSWARWWKRGARGVHLYYVLWQWGAYRVARRLCRGGRFDVAHHITFGVFRQPSFMAFLGIPFVFGPLGGGETSPHSLRGTYPLRGLAADRARDLANWYARFDPVLRAVYRRSAITLCKTAQTLDHIPRKYRDRCRLCIELGTESEAPHRAPSKRSSADGFRVLYVGRLLYWKGMHLGIAAFAGLRAQRDDARLTIIGSGPEQSRLQELARRSGVEAAITWIPWTERAEVMRAYRAHDAFLFPSLHDSSGNAVLEAMSCSLPVVCLDTGGPAELLDAESGFRVPAGAAAQAVAGLAGALITLASDVERARRMGDAARRRAQHFSWERQVARMEAVYRDAITSFPEAARAPSMRAIS